MKHRNLGRFLIAAASISMAVSPITALANTVVPVVYAEDETVAVDHKMLLKQAITYAEEQIASPSYQNVVPKVKTNLENKLAAAKDLAKDGVTASDDEINAAWSALVNAVHYLDFTGDRSGLEAAVAETLNESDYTKESWSDYAAAVANGNKVLENENALDAELTEALNAIVDAKEALVEDKSEPEPGPGPVDPVVKADKTALKKAIADAKGKNSADYTPESWSAVAAALKTAEAVDADENASQTAVDNAAADLKSAVAALVEDHEEEEVDKTALTEAIRVYDALTEGKKKDNYTPASMKVYDTAKADADKVAANTSASKADVDKAVKAMADAKAGLESFMYRMYNPNTGEHVFTTDKNEYTYQTTQGPWNAEGQAWVAPSEGRQMYRLYNPNADDHHYTSSQKEYDYLASVGWQKEGPKWNSAEKDDDGAILIHRLYNPNAEKAGAHHYTMDTREKDYLDGIGWNVEANESDLIYAKRSVADSEKE